MEPTTIIVQDIPTEFICRNYDNSSNSKLIVEPTNPLLMEQRFQDYVEQKRQKLNQFFSQFGPAQCTYVTPKIVLRERPLLPQRYKCKYTSAVMDDFAHITFDNYADALEVWKAGQRHEIKMGNRVLTITLIQDGVDMTESLNSDCLIKIFARLSARDKLNVECVCERWKKLVLHSWCYQNVLLLDSSVSLDQFEKYAIRCGPFLLVLHYHVLYQDDKSTYEIAAQHCPNIETLQLHLTHSDENNERFHERFCAALQNLKKLRTLKLKHLFKNFHYCFVNYLPVELVELWLCGDSNTIGTPQNMMAIDVSRFPCLRTIGFQNLIIPAGGLKGIEHLELLSYFNCMESRIHPSLINKLEHLTRLECIALYCSGVTNNVIENIVKNNQGLKSVELCFAVLMTDRGLMAISRYAKHLKQFRLWHMMHIRLNFLDEMPKLMEFDCNDCPHVREKNLIKILRTSPKLRIIRVLGCKVTEKFLEAANEAVKARNNNYTLTVTTTLHCHIKREHISPKLIIDNVFPDALFDDPEDNDLVQ